MMKATIFEIKRFAVHDGDGIRTTVFFKGCPLKCLWCHNPEGISCKPQLSWLQSKCVSCGACAAACPQGAHKIEQGIHTLDRDKCSACGNCENLCPAEALKVYGKQMTVAQLLPILLEDQDFYVQSGGGVTLSGGECLMQADFCAALLKELKAHNIHTAVDTCGFVPREAIQKVLPYTDVFLYDLKAMDEAVHIKCTGQSNRLILENLKYIDEAGKAIEIRVPYVPSYNSGEAEQIKAFAGSLKNLTKIKFLPYHNYAGSKYQALDMENTLPQTLPSQEEMDRCAKL